MRLPINAAMVLFTFACGAGAALFSSCAWGAMEGARPNIIVLFADDMNYAGPSCYGNRWDMETPNIDRLASRGVRFTDAYVTAPTCGPSRAGLITGRHQCRFGHEFNSPRREGIGLPLSEKTIGDRMKALGYRTGIIGKWHLGGDENVGAEYHPLQRGFDEFYGFYGSMVFFFRSDHIFRGTEKVREREYLTDAIARESCHFIGRHRDRPFFLYVPFNAVHTPLEATEGDLDAVRDLPLPVGAPERLAKLEGDKRAKAEEKIHLRRAMLLALDRAVGRIVEKVETLGLADNTLVVFANDNGDYSRNGPFGGGKGSAREGGIRVPFIMRWQGRLPAGAVFSQPVSTLDILPTSIAAAGGLIDPGWRLDGVDLMPYLTGKAEGPPHDRLFWRMGNEKAVREGPWKLRYSGGSGYGWRPGPGQTVTWELHNLTEDPAEQSDLSTAQPEKTAALLAAYNRWEATLSPPLWTFGASGQMGRWTED